MQNSSYHDSGLKDDMSTSPNVLTLMKEEMNRNSRKNLGNQSTVLRENFNVDTVKTINTSSELKGKRNTHKKKFQTQVKDLELGLFPLDEHCESKDNNQS